MKYTIFGFSQEQVLNLCDEHQSIDERDLMILRWIIDFYFGGMEKRVIDGVEYGWVNASYVCEELPIMRLTPEAVRRRLKKLVKFGLLYHRQVKNSEVGTRAYYRPTEHAVQLQSDTGATSKCDGGTTSKSHPVPLQSSNKDSSISDPSIINQSITHKKKEGKRAGYDEIIDSYTENGELRSALVEFVKMRKMMKKPLTNRALSLLLTSKKGLDGLASTDAEKIDIVQQSIMRAWLGFFPLKDDGHKPSQQSKRASRNESSWEKTEEEKQDEEAWMKNIIQC